MAREMTGPLSITGAVNASGTVTANQASTTAAVPALVLQQLDLSEELIEFDGVVATGNPIEAKGAKVQTVTHFVRVSINGTFYYLAAGTIA